MRGANESGPWRILVLGPPGAGKSTAAVALGHRLGLPVTHLDWEWSSGGGMPSRKAFQENLAVAVGSTEWILDGAIPAGVTVALADHVVVLLDLPLTVRLARLVRRRRRIDRPGELALRRRVLLVVVGAFHPLSWRRHHRKRARALAEGGRLVVLRSDAEVEKLIAEPTALFGGELPHAG